MCGESLRCDCVQFIRGPAPARAAPIARRHEHDGSTRTIHENGALEISLTQSHGHTVRALHPTCHVETTRLIEDDVPFTDMEVSVACGRWPCCALCETMDRRHRVQADCVD